MKRHLLLAGFGLLSGSVVTYAQQPAATNLLIITVDDMSAESVGAFGCKLPDTTPNIDRLAVRGVRFNQAHVVVANCMPSRNVMWSGLYPHHSGVEGFYAVPNAKYPHLVDLMKSAGYFTAIRGKVSHSTPYVPYAWDTVLSTLPDGRQVDPKNPESYYTSMSDGIRQAHRAGKPFCLMMNVSDPHKPFYAQKKNGNDWPDDPNVPTRVFAAAEVPVPGFLPDDPVVREELAHYYSSVRRADDSVGQILRALRDAGDESNTLIVFLSDHGMPFPFSKTEVYEDSTHTPLFFVWPGHLPEGVADNTHMVSSVDLLPTILDLLNIKNPGTMDGHSFVSLLHGGQEGSRRWIIKEYIENSGGIRNPMRAIQTLNDLYIFNPWADGRREMKTATTHTKTYRRMVELAKSHSVAAARLKLFQYRTPEEFYHVSTDPSCMTNCIDNPATPERLNELRTELADWMRRENDPALDSFLMRNDPAALAAFMEQQDAEALAHKKTKQKEHNTTKRNAVPVSSRSLSFDLPELIEAGKSLTIRVHYDLPPDNRILTVTLKEGQTGEKLERKTVAVQGAGVAEVTFNVPPGLDETVRFAVFAGAEFKPSVPYVVSQPVPVQ